MHRCPHLLEFFLLDLLLSLWSRWVSKLGIKINHFQLRCHVLWAGKLRASWKVAIARGNDMRQRTADHYKVAIKCQIRNDWWPTPWNGAVQCPLIQLNGVIIQLGGAAKRSGTHFCVIGDIAWRAGQQLSPTAIRNMNLSSDCPWLHRGGAWSSLYGEIGLHLWWEHVIADALVAGWAWHA